LKAPTQASAAWWVVLAGVCAALHVGKLAPAIPTLQNALGLTLVQAGFLLSLVQAAGMLLGVGFGAVSDTLGARRSLLLGLLLLAGASAGGGAAHSVAPLMAWRVLEGFGFLLVVVTAPGLVRQLVAPQRVNAMLGVWGAYMSVAATLALLLGPLVIGSQGWRVWWWGLAVLTAVMAGVVAWVLPKPQADQAKHLTPNKRAQPLVHTFDNTASLSWAGRLRATLSAPGPWAVALCFALYTSQWLAVIGFLPSIVLQAGLPVAAVALLTAGAAAANVVGNVAAGQLLQRGVAPQRLLRWGFVGMALATLAAFLGWPLFAANGLPTPVLPAGWRYLAVVVFSGVGGLIPATLFALAVRLAPSPATQGTTLGWLQQWSSIGQFVGPPLVAAVANAVGGWHATWVVTGLASCAGLGMAAVLSRLIKNR
jgi:MFS transporter, CP family, cyanate transporter